MTRSLPGTLVLLLTLVLAGCATAPSPVAPAASVAPIPPTAAVVPPAPAAPAVPAAPVLPVPPATLVGSEESSTLFDNFTAFVTAVDGQAVAAGRPGWNTPLPLPAGTHRLKVAFNRGVFVAEAELSLNAGPGGAYQLKFASDAEIYGKNSFCEFWIVDTVTGETVTSPRRVPLARIAETK